jgi:hypothetical protein
MVDVRTSDSEEFRGPQVLYKHDITRMALLG